MFVLVECEYQARLDFLSRHKTPVRKSDVKARSTRQFIFGQYKWFKLKKSFMDKKKREKF